MQLDAEESGDPFYKPPSQPPAAQISKSDEPTSKPVQREENDAEAASTATVEQEA